MRLSLIKQVVKRERRGDDRREVDDSHRRLDARGQERASGEDATRLRRRHAAAYSERDAPCTGAAAAAGLEGGLLPASSLWVRALAIHGRSLVGGTGWGAATPYAGEGGDAAVLLWDMDREASAGTAVPQTRAAPQAGDVWALVSKGGRVWAAVGRDVLLWE